MPCKNCGAENPEGAVYCHNCGSRMDGMRACLSCGFLMAREYYFCPAGGGDFGGPAALFYSPPPFQG